jgi:hypothetical protein
MTSIRVLMSKMSYRTAQALTISSLLVALYLDTISSAAGKLLIIASGYFTQNKFGWETLIVKDEWF